jgi:VWFA-related protein
VQDASGNFVSDLSREDFEVLEDGAPQQIDAVFLVTGGAAPVPVNPAAPSPEALAVSTGVPRVANNRRVFIFFFDNDHILSPAALDRGRKAMSDFIQAQFRPGDVGGIVSDGKMIGNRLTSSTEELLAAAKSVKPTDQTRSRMLDFREWPRFRDDLEVLRVERDDQEALQNVMARACAEQPDTCAKVPVDAIVREKASRLARETRTSTEAVLRAADGLANGLARLPGLKVVVFFSDGFVVENNFERLQGAVGRAGRSGVRFYTIDLRGLNRQPEIFEAPVVDDPAGAPGKFDLQSDGTNSLALDTGGLAFRNYNEFEKPMEAIARDTAMYYVIGYRPKNQEFDGQYRKIAVHVKRPGVKLRARHGYAAIAQVPPAGSDGGFRKEVPQGGSAAKVLRSTGTDPQNQLAEPTGGTNLRNRPAEPSGGTNSRNQPAEPVSARVRSLIERDPSIARATPSAASTNSLAKDGWAKYEKGDVEGARDALSRAATRDARPWVFYALGQSEFALQHYDRAIAAWKTVRERVPEFEEVYFDLADAHLQRGELSDSVSVLRDAARRWPKDQQVFNALGVIYARRDALDDAVNAFKQAATLAPDDALSRFNLARAYHLRYVKSRHYIPALQRWVQNDGDRKHAMDEYTRYLEIGGPQEQSVRDALRALNEVW